MSDELSSLLMAFGYFCEKVLPLLAIAWGANTLKEKLHQNYMERYFEEAMSSNRNAFNRARKILLSVEDERESSGHLDQAYLDHLADQARKLAIESERGSTLTASLSLLYSELLDSLRIEYTSPKESILNHYLGTRDLNRVSDGLLRCIMHYSTAVPVPHRLKFTKRIGIKKRFQKYILGKGTYFVSDVATGLDLRPCAEPFLTASSIAAGAESPYIDKAMYQLVQSNAPLIYSMLGAKYYMPMYVLCGNSPIGGEHGLTLIKLRDHKIKWGDGEDTVLFYYANIGFNINFLDSSNPEKIVEKIFSSSYILRYLYSKGLYSYQHMADEVLMISIPRRIARRNYYFFWFYLKYRLRKIKHLSRH